MSVFVNTIDSITEHSVCSSGILNFLFCICLLKAVDAKTRKSQKVDWGRALWSGHLPYGGWQMHYLTNHFMCTEKKLLVSYNLEQIWEQKALEMSRRHRTYRQHCKNKNKKNTTLKWYLMFILCVSANVSGRDFWRCLKQLWNCACEMKLGLNHKSFNYYGLCLEFKQNHFLTFSCPDAVSQ